MTETPLAPSPHPAGAATAPPPRSPALTVVAAVLLVVAVVCAAVFGFRWFESARGGETTTAQTRDAALDDARQAAINLTTINSDDVGGTLSNWNAVVTGDLATEFSSMRTELEQRISSQPGSTSVVIVNAALTTLDAPAGTATAVIFADVTTTVPESQPLIQRFALNLSVQRTDDGWKAAAIQSLVQNAGIQ